jgi:hypothetical protein
MKYLTNILKTLEFKNTPFITVGGSFVFWLFLMALGVSSAQEIDPQLSESNGYVFEGNSIVEDDFIGAEKKYRLAVSTKQNNAIGSFNLGNAYYNSELYDEALFRHLEAAQNSTSKPEKHKAYHNIGTILMQKKQCKEAVSAFKNALRNNPEDDESRYNLALAQECAKEQGGDGDGDDEDKDKDKDENKDDKNDSDEKQDKDDKNKDEGDKDDKNEGEDKEDEDGKPKDDKGDQKNNDPKDDKGKPQQQPGKLSPQQVKNLLEAMNNEEKKVQEKMNASKTKGVKVKTEKDW